RFDARASCSPSSSKRFVLSFWLLRKKRLSENSFLHKEIYVANQGSEKTAQIIPARYIRFHDFRSRADRLRRFGTLARREWRRRKIKSNACCGRRRGPEPRTISRQGGAARSMDDVVSSLQS